MKRIILTAGFESCNNNLYRQAAEMTIDKMSRVGNCSIERSQFCFPLLKK